MLKPSNLADAFSVRRRADPARNWRVALALFTTFGALVLINRLFCKDSLGNSAFWPADGAMVAALLLLPRRLSLLTISACFVLNIAANTFADYTVFDNLLFSTLNVGVSGLTAILTRRFCGAATDLSRARRLGVFAGVSLLAASLEAGVGEPLKWSAGEPGVDLNDWVQWTLCDCLGLIIATPAILLVVKRRRYANNFKSSGAERLLLVLFAAACTVLTFVTPKGAPLLFFIYPLLILVAFRAGPVWVLFTIAGVSMIASGFTAHGLGPLAKLSATGALLRPDIMQPFLMSLLACALPSNNALNEANRAANRLARLHRLARQAQLEAVSANLAKSQFIANISHEIRTPMNGVLGMTQALVASELTDQQRARLEVIRSSGEVLLGLLNDVLDLSKIEAGKLELEVTDFRIHNVCSSVQSTFSAVADTKGIQLSTHYDLASNVMHSGDPTRVRQIVTNLVSNALKFTESGSVRVLVSGDAETLTLEVIDTGIGIPDEKIDKLFAKFEQADTSTTRRFGGTGLGLSICNDLVSLMNGAITVSSTPGSGSAFKVVLPLPSRVTEEILSSGVSEEALLGVEAEGPELRVLAAEDNPTNQLVLKTLLAQVGVEPTIVDNGVKAVEAWEAQDFDVILMDMQMPVMDGLTAAAKIRSLEQDNARRRTPIVAFTANVMAHQIKSYTAAGIDAVVAKPVEFQKLIDALAAVLAAGDTEPAAAHVAVA